MGTAGGMGRVGLSGRVALTCMRKRATGKLLRGTELSLALFDDLEGWEGEMEERFKRRSVYVYLRLIHLVA